MSIREIREEVAVELVTSHDEETCIPKVEFDLTIYDRRLGHYATVGSMCIAAPSRKEKILEACYNLLPRITGPERQILARGIGHAKHALAYII